MDVKEIVNEFNEKYHYYELLDQKVTEILTEIVEENDFFILPIMHRIKSKDSLTHKVQKKKNVVHKLNDLGDVCAFRIIAYFEDDIDRIGEAISKRLNIEEIVDKRKALEATQFGYLSLHYICTLKSEDLPDPACDGILFEIQMRTVLQHAWAEIEHDLGYKSAYGVPAPIRRNFSKVASLLEVADNEFIRLRDSSNAYNEEVRTKIVNGTANNLLLDHVSLYKYMELNTGMQEYYQSLLNDLNIEIYVTDTDNYLEQLRWLGITTLGQLNECFMEHKDRITWLFKERLKTVEFDFASCTIVIRYMCTAELVKRQLSDVELKQYYAIFMPADKIDEKIDKIKEYTSKLQ